MKILLLISVYLLVSLSLSGQIIDPKESAKRSAENRTNSKIDEGINKGFDKIEEGIGNIFKKKEKKKVEKKEENAENQETSQNSKPTSSNGSSGNSTSSSSSTKSSMKAYSKFDFVSGEKIIAVEDFSQDAIGDFPAKWNTNASGEVVTFDGNSTKWLKLGDRGVFFPDFVNELPENFTLEFDMMVSEDLSENLSGLRVFFPEIKYRKLTFDQQFGTDPQVGFDIHPVPNIENNISHVWVFDKNQDKILENSLPIQWKQNTVNRISIWRQKSRIRLYVNEAKVWDLPKAFDPTLKYSMLLADYLFAGAIYMTNLKVAVGTPDTRNKLITEGKFVTRGILFDVNSDKIKPESYGILKEIGGVLKENPTVKVKIIGHTDSDGDDNKNLDLSKRRAVSVKNALSAEFGIPTDQMETDGKGETQPSDANSTVQGKANNRRVEFIKL